MPEYIMVFIIKNAIAYCYEIKKEKKKRERNSEIKGKNRSRSHDWPKKAPKPCEVLQRFFAELNESMKLPRSERTSTRSGKIFQLWALKCGTCLSFPENCWNRRSKRIEAVRTHRYGCWSSNERVCNRSVRTTLTMEPSCVCLIELKAELIIKLER